MTGRGERLRRLDDAVVRRLRRLTRTDPGDRPPGVVATVRRRPGRLALVAVGIAFVGALRHAAVYPDLAQERANREAAQQAQGTAVLPADAAVVGPTEGAGAAAYVAARADALAELEDPEERRTAVVSFVDFEGPDTAAGIVADVDARAVQYQLPDGSRPVQTDAALGEVESSVARALVAVIERVDVELAAQEDLLADPSFDDPDFRADALARVNELQAERRVLTGAAEVVFAVVVDGTVAQLRELADRSTVRLVDVASGELELDDAAFFGLLPDQQQVLRFGAPPA